MGDNQNIDYQQMFNQNQNKSKEVSFVTGGVIDPNQKNVQGMLQNSGQNKGQVYKPNQDKQQSVSEQINQTYIKEKQESSFSSNRNDSTLAATKKNNELFKEQLKKQNLLNQKQQQNIQLNTVLQQKSKQGINYEKKRMEKDPIYKAISSISKVLPHSFCDIGDLRYITIYGLTLQQDNQFLSLIFQEFGEIEYIGRKAIYDEHDIEANAKIIGYVIFKTQEQAQNAIQNQNLQIKLGSKCTMRYGQPIFTCASLQDIANSENKKQQIMVEIPQNHIVRRHIDRYARLVQADGYIVEKYIQENMMDNTLYSFIFLENCQEHIYYKWRLYSFLQGNSEKTWSENTFQMTHTGPVWHPPEIQTDVSVAELMDKEYEPQIKKKQLGTDLLPDDDRYKLEDLLRNLNVTRYSIGEAMVYCMDHFNCAGDIILIITQAVKQANDNHQILLARMYLISDLLHNCSKSSPNYWSFRTFLQYYLPEIMKYVNKAFKKQQSQSGIKADKFSEKIKKILNLWQEESIYDLNYINGLESILQQNPNNFITKDNKIYYKYDIESEIGVKLQQIEKQYENEDYEMLQRYVSTNGLVSYGTKEELVAQIVMLEEFKMKKINLNPNQEMLFDLSTEQGRNESILLVTKISEILYTSQHKFTNKNTIQDYINDSIKLLTFLEQRNLAVTSAANTMDGQPLDEIDEILYDLKDNNQGNQIQTFQISSSKNNFLKNIIGDDIDGEELTLEEIKKIQNKFYNVLCYHELDLLYKNVDPQLLSQPIQNTFNNNQNINNQNNTFQVKTQAIKSFKMVEQDIVPEPPTEQPPASLQIQHLNQVQQRIPQMSKSKSRSKDRKKKYRKDEKSRSRSRGKDKSRKKSRDRNRKSRDRDRDRDRKDSKKSKKHYRNSSSSSRERNRKKKSYNY